MTERDSIGGRQGPAPAGDAFSASFTADYYRDFMRQWEQQLSRVIA